MSCIWNWPRQLFWRGGGGGGNQIYRQKGSSVTDKSQILEISTYPSVVSDLWKMFAQYAMPFLLISYNILHGESDNQSVKNAIVSCSFVLINFNCTDETSKNHYGKGNSHHPLAMLWYIKVTVWVVWVVVNLSEKYNVLENVCLLYITWYNFLIDCNVKIDISDRVNPLLPSISAEFDLRPNGSDEEHMHLRRHEATTDVWLALDCKEHLPWKMILLSSMTKDRFPSELRRKEQTVDRR